jgi:hypothetical protein
VLVTSGTPPRDPVFERSLVKKVVLLLTCLGALALPIASFAGGGSGRAGLSAHLTRLYAHVSKYSAKCGVANPSAKCAAKDAKLTAKLSTFEAKIHARLNQHPNSSRLQSALTEINSLQAKL